MKDGKMMASYADQIRRAEYEGEKRYVGIIRIVVLSSVCRVINHLGCSQQCHISDDMTSL